MCMCIPHIFSLFSDFLHCILHNFPRFILDYLLTLTSVLGVFTHGPRSNYHQCVMTLKSIPVALNSPLTLLLLLLNQLKSMTLLGYILF